MNKKKLISTVLAICCVPLLAGCSSADASSSPAASDACSQALRTAIDASSTAADSSRAFAGVTTELASAPASEFDRVADASHTSAADNQAVSFAYQALSGLSAPEFSDAASTISAQTADAASALEAFGDASAAYAILESNETTDNLNSTAADALDAVGLVEESLSGMTSLSDEGFAGACN